MEMQKQEDRIVNNNEINLLELIKPIWNGRILIVYSTGICLVIGILIALVSPKKYMAYSTLLPSLENSSSAGIGNLSSLASMAGVNIGSGLSNENSIPSDLYPEIIQSYPFLNEFINEKFNFEEYSNPISIYNFVSNDTVPSLGYNILKYTVLLPLTIKDALINHDNDEPKGVDYGVLILTKEEIKALKEVEKVFNVEVDDVTGLVTVSAEVNEPVLSAQFVQKGIELLQKYIIDYKTKQSNENLNFVQQRYDEKKAEYEKVQEEFLNYKDQHRNIISERININYQRLSDNYDILSSVYKSLAQELEQAKIAVKKETPVYAIIEPAKVPKMPSSPNKMLILVLSCFLGVAVGVLIIFGKILLKKIKKELMG